MIWRNKEDNFFKWSNNDLDIVSLTFHSREIYLFSWLYFTWDDKDHNFSVIYLARHIPSRHIWMKYLSNYFPNVVYDIVKYLTPHFRRSFQVKALWEWSILYILDEKSLHITSPSIELQVSTTRPKANYANIPARKRTRYSAEIVHWGMYIL